MLVKLVSGTFCIMYILPCCRTLLRVIAWTCTGIHIFLLHIFTNHSLSLFPFPYSITISIVLVHIYSFVNIERALHNTPHTLSFSPMLDKYANALHVDHVHCIQLSYAICILHITCNTVYKQTLMNTFLDFIPIFYFILFFIIFIIC